MTFCLVTEYIAQLCFIISAFEVYARTPPLCNLKHSNYSEQAPHSEIGIDTINSY